MNNISLKLLKYLYENDNGDYIDVNNAFNNKNKPSKKRLSEIYYELKDYIKYESHYNYSETEIKKSEKENILLIKAKITHKGIEYYLSQQSAINSILTNKKNIYIGVIAIIISFSAFTVPLLLTNKNAKIEINNANFPLPKVWIVNKTNDTIKIYRRQEFVLWKPSDRYIKGKYELINDNDNNDLYIIYPNKKVKYTVDIDNKGKFFGYFQQKENDIVVNIRTQKKGKFYSSELPFNKKWVEKYYAEIIVE